MSEFCWSTWLVALFLTGLCVLSGGLQILASVPRWREQITLSFRYIENRSTWVVNLLVVGAAAGLMAIAFQIYTMLFAFYGIFLSFFAEMEPHALFGRNGFINSDFWTPVRHLVLTFWPMCIGAAITHGGSLLHSGPWRRMLLPIDTEIMRAHLMVVLMPFLALAAWALVGDAYQSPVVVLLMALFFFLPKRSINKPSESQADPSVPLPAELYPPSSRG